MDIDERLEKLTERHEALTQTVEIVAAMQKDTDRRLEEVLETIVQLGHIAESHDRRPDGLEGSSH